LELYVFCNATGLNILGTRHERAENGERFPDTVREFFVNENSATPEIAIAALEICQKFLDSHQNNPKKKSKK